MPPASPIPDPWDERYRHLHSLRSVLDEAAHTVSIGVAELIVGDQLFISDEPFVVTSCEPDGAYVHVEAVRDTRTITNLYLRLESVEVMAPRPAPFTDRKALT
jgi:hypothetical protein